MDFSLTTLFILPNGTAATSGSTQDLAANAWGIFRPDYSVANAGNAAAAKYLYFAQGRPEVVPGLGSKRSDKIAKENVIDWYKVTAEQDVASQITEISNFDVQCGQEITFAFRLHSSYIDSGFFNGLSKAITVKTACCDCGGDPCTDVDPQSTIDTFIAAAAAQPLNVSGVGNATLASFLNFERIGTGTNSILRVSAKPLTKYSNPFDVSLFPYEYDRLWFRAFVIKGPLTTQDFIVNDACDNVAKVLVTQRATYGRGSSDEIKQLEKDFYSYQTTHKHLFRNIAWNNAFSSQVVDGTYYDLYVLKFKDYKDQQTTWAGYVPLDSTILIAIPTGTGATLEAILNAHIGTNVEDKSGYNVTTTTTTSTTSSTTSTTTTTLFP